MLKRVAGVTLALAVLSALGAGLCSADTITSMTAGTALEGASDATWWYGCSPTSAGMLMGYYDRNGYDGLTYDNLVPGGVAELSTYGNNNALLNNIIASPGHISEFYGGDAAPGNTKEGSTGDDVLTTRGFDCLADFMGTSQDKYKNPDGWTTWWYDPSGGRVTDSDITTINGTGEVGDSLLYGLKEYAEYAGYDGSGYNQLVDTYVNNGNGFTWADYKAEIDAGRPVLIQLAGHTMLGFGYDETGGKDNVELYDTWSDQMNEMLWGTSYGGMAMMAVTTFTLTGGTATPEPATCLLALFSACTAAYVRKRRKGAENRMAA